MLYVRIFESLEERDKTNMPFSKLLREIDFEDSINQIGQRGLIRLMPP